MRAADDGAALAAAICAACARLHARGLIGGAEGNVSVRLADGSLLATPSGADKATLTPAQLVRCTMHPDTFEVTVQGAPRDGRGHASATRASSEIRMHVALYAARPEIRAVVHAHPPVATGFATAGRPLPSHALPELLVNVGPIALVPYARPGTAALPTVLAPFAASHHAFLLAHHGATTVGSSLGAALARMESLEQAARVLLSAQLLGGTPALPAQEVAALQALVAPL